MATLMILELHADHPQPRRIQQVVDALRAGMLVAYPTDTVYAIGCDVFHRGAVQRLHQLVHEIKGSPEHAPLSFICHSLSNISEYAQVNDYAYRTLRRLLPGPYTFILEATKLVPKVMLNRRKTVGIRIPDSAIPIKLVEALGNPMATTSAALPGGDLLADPWAIQSAFGHMVDIVIDAGYIFPEPSTIIDFTQDYPQLVRRGKGPLDELEIVEVI